jgi:hypothetical protein
MENDALFAYRTDKPECDWMDHRLTWCGDCYACADCGRRAELTRPDSAALEVANLLKDAKVVIERAIASTTSGADHDDLCTVRNRIDKALAKIGE